MRSEPPELPSAPPTIRITQEDLYLLADARDLLGHQNLPMRLTHAMGGPIEKGFKLLPKNWSQNIQGLTSDALTKALQFALLTLDPHLAQRHEYYHDK